MDDINKHEEETREKWGDTEAYKQSQERVKKMNKEELAQSALDMDKIIAEIAECMKEGEAPESEKVQALIARHYHHLRTFYEPNLQIYRGLADIYVSDERFRSHYEKMGKGLAEFIRNAMIAYCNNEEG
ncbi:MAG: TipAS antibiotic-recognition domain-containing protein [Candidatus Parcubacteria bacterium]|nr:TipAS antibiotic-recognition domain-containing protein [Candidatus Parcubacteria bacterium]